MNPKAPTASLVIATFNNRPFVRQAIDSLINQSYPAFEVVVVDDGSTDGTAEVLEEYQRRDARVRVYRQENKGQAAALNRACDLARGDYLVRMDPDDESFPERLDGQLSFLERNVDVAMVGCAAIVISANGLFVETVRFPTLDSEIRAELQHRNVFSHSAVVMRREAFEGAGGFRRALWPSCDYDLWLRISERHKVANLAEPLILYRMHEGQISRLQPEAVIISFLAGKASARIRRNGGPDPLFGLQDLSQQTLELLGVTRQSIEEAMTAYEQNVIDAMLVSFEQSANLQRWVFAKVCDQLTRFVGMH